MHNYERAFLLHFPAERWRAERCLKCARAANASHLVPRLRRRARFLTSTFVRSHVRNMCAFDPLSAHSASARNCTTPL